MKQTARSHVSAADVAKDICMYIVLFTFIMPILPFLVLQLIK